MKRKAEGSEPSGGVERDIDASGEGCDGAVAGCARKARDEQRDEGRVRKDPYEQGCGTSAAYGSSLPGIVVHLPDFAGGCMAGPPEWRLAVRVGDGRMVEVLSRVTTSPGTSVKQTTSDSSSTSSCSKPEVEMWASGRGWQARLRRPNGKVFEDSVANLLSRKCGALTVEEEELLRTMRDEKRSERELLTSRGAAAKGDGVGGREGWRCECFGMLENT